MLKKFDIYNRIFYMYVGNFVRHLCVLVLRHQMRVSNYFVNSFYSVYSTLLHFPPLRFHCIGGCMLGSNPGLLRLSHRQSDALTPSQGLIHDSTRSHPRWMRRLHIKKTNLCVSLKTSGAFSKYDKML